MSYPRGPYGASYHGGIGGSFGGDQRQEHYRRYHYVRPTNSDGAGSSYANDFPMHHQQQRPQFGNRHLTDPEDVFQHNAWDNVVWSAEQEQDAKDTIVANSKTPVAPALKEKYNTEANEYWNKFYEIHNNKFFKDRNWLFTEFPEFVSNSGELSDSGAGESNASAEAAQTDSSAVASSNDPPAEAATSNPSAETATSDPSAEATAAADPPLNVTVSDAPAVATAVDQPVKAEAADPQANTTISDAPAEADPSAKSDPCKIETDDSSVKAETEPMSLKTDPDAPPGQDATFRVLEIGCGVGNTVFPLLEQNRDPGLFVYCCDFSTAAIDILKTTAQYDKKRCHAFVCDVTEAEWDAPFAEGSLDVVSMIFVLSAINPDRYQHIVDTVAKYLKPGGRLLFRDYGRYDLSQLRFKDGQCLSDNFYVRGDGTRTYFFTREEAIKMFTTAGLTQEAAHVDQRLQVNRGRKIKMYRVWVQCKFRKPLSE